MIREQSIAKQNTDSLSQAPPPGENAGSGPPQPGQLGPPEHQTSRDGNQAFKSGHLFVSSKGIGWTSWKKRWFILTRTSLVFFRSDPSAVPQKVGEMHLTLGGIDLNNSASVEVKADKKLLTVFFPDGRDGRAFTLKAETSEDLYEWKTALETAVAQAPSVSASGNEIFNNEQDEAANEPVEPQIDKLPAKSMVVGRPVLLALEDIDGSPSFLEKALRFIEQHGVTVEGILRQAADVDDVYRRVHEYEKGRTEFSTDEDAHVIADCIKYILRELPSSPVPASCCKALLEAFRSDRNNRLNNMRTAILDTFPEPNRRLLQRILLMMQQIAAHKAENRMSVSGVAACMSPLLLRPLLAGECELENTHMEVAGDGSFQLLQAAAAANHAQAIVITLLEEYDNIFGEGSGSPELFSDSDESYSGTEDGTEDDETCDEDDEDDDSGDYEHSGSETCSDSGDHGGSDSHDDKKNSSSSCSSSSSSKSSSSSSSKSHKRGHRRHAKRLPSSLPHEHDSMRRDSTKKQNNPKHAGEVNDTKKSHRKDVPREKSSVNELVSPKSGSRAESAELFESTSQGRRALWGRTPARKNVPMESVDYKPDDEEGIKRLENVKSDLENQIAEKANHNAALQVNLEKRKKDLHERRLALEKDVARLQDQLQKEKDIGAALESGDISRLPADMDEKTKAQLKEIGLAQEKNNNMTQRVDDLGVQINQQRDKNTGLIQERSTAKKETSSRGTMLQNNKDNASKDTSHYVERSSKNEGQHNNKDGTNRDKDGRNESSSSNERSNIESSNKSLGSSFKKSGKGEGGNTTTTTLSKLSNRLNFLKERRTQIANELENIDKVNGSITQSSSKGKGPEEKSQGREGNSIQNREDNSRQLSSHTSMKGTPPGNDNKKGLGSKSETQHSDRGRKTEKQSSQHIDKLKPGGSKTSDKDRQQDSKQSEQPKKQDVKPFK